MVPLLVSVTAGGFVVGLLVGAIGLLVVRSAAPRPAARRPSRQIQLAEDALLAERDSRSAA